ncbi:MAG: hypothetical protein O7D96_04955 [SAR324 cluster bacterium]|nr:hypothetical protein [SAR324 cluster bacterium]
MKVFHNSRSAEYNPSHSFFNGRFATYPDTPERMEAIPAAIGADGRFAPEAVSGLSADGAAVDAAAANWAAVDGAVAAGRGWFRSALQFFGGRKVS